MLIYNVLHVIDFVRNKMPHISFVFIMLSLPVHSTKLNNNNNNNNKLYFKRVAQLVFTNLT